MGTIACRVLGGRGCTGDHKRSCAGSAHGMLLAALCHPRSSVVGSVSFSCSAHRLCCVCVLRGVINGGEMYKSLLVYDFPPPGLNYFGHFSRPESVGGGKRSFEAHRGHTAYAYNGHRGALLFDAAQQQVRGNPEYRRKYEKISLE